MRILVAGSAAGGCDLDWRFVQSLNTTLGIRLKLSGSQKDENRLLETA